MKAHSNDLLLANTDAITEVSYVIVYALSALFMLLPIVMLVALVWSGIRERKRRATRPSRSPAPQLRSSMTTQQAIDEP